MEREVEAKKNVSDFCISFAEGALRVASTSEKKEVRKVLRVILTSA